MPRLNITPRKLRRKSINSIAPSRDGQYAYDPASGRILVSKDGVWHLYGEAPVTPPANPFAALYGTGMGQIPLHLRPEDAVTDGSGNVTAIPNKGGAGAAFNLSVTGSGITKQSSLLNIASTTVLADLATSANMRGTRMFFVAQPLVSTTSYRYFGSSNAATRIGEEKVVVFRSGPSTTGTISTGVPAITTPTLIEIEMDGASVQAWFNGTSVGAASFAVSSYPISRIARGNGAGAEFVGLMGDFLYVITDGTPAMNATMLTVRQALAAKHGIALP